MTGTAATEGPEFSNIYNLAVTVVPTNQSAKRTDESDVVFRTEEGEWASFCVVSTRVSICLGCVACEDVFLGWSNIAVPFGRVPFGSVPFGCLSFGCVSIWLYTHLAVYHLAL